MPRYRIGSVGGRSIKVSRRHQGSTRREPSAGGSNSNYRSTGNRFVDLAISSLIVLGLLWPFNLLRHPPIDAPLVVLAFIGPLGLAGLIAVVYTDALARRPNPRQAEIDQEVQETYLTPAVRERVLRLYMILLAEPPPSGLEPLPIPPDDALTLPEYLGRGYDPPAEMTFRLWVNERLAMDVPVQTVGKVIQAGIAHGQAFALTGGSAVLMQHAPTAAPR